MKVPSQIRGVDRDLKNLAAGASQGGVRAQGFYDLLRMMPIAASGVSAIVR